MANEGEKDVLVSHDGERQSSPKNRRELFSGFQYGSLSFRAVMLTLTVTVVFSGYFSYDLPGITAEQLKRDLKQDNEALGLIFAMYALPNAVIPIIAGMFYTRVGIWNGIITIAAVISVGICIVALAVEFKSYTLLLAGRFAYGFVGESVYVGVDVLTTDWFAGHELGLAYGIIQAAGQCGSFAAFYGAPALINLGNKYTFPYYVAAVISVLALGCLFVARKVERGSVRNTTLNDGNGVSTHADATAHEAQHVGATNERSESGIGTSASAGTSLPSSAVTASASARCYNSSFITATGLHHFRKLHLEFFLVLISISIYSAVFYTFLAFGNDFLISTRGMDMTEAGKHTGIISLCSAILSPLSGYMMDKLGGHAYVAFAAMVMSLVAFSTLAFTLIPIAIPILLAGVSYAVLPSSLYPLVAETVPPEAFTQVYALTNASVNFVLVLSFYGTGWLTRVEEESEADDAPTGNYAPMFWGFILLASLGVGATFELSRRWFFWGRAGRKGFRVLADDAASDGEQMDSGGAIDDGIELASGTGVMLTVSPRGVGTDVALGTGGDAGGSDGASSSTAIRSRVRVGKSAARESGDAVPRSGTSSGGNSTTSSSQSSLDGRYWAVEASTAPQFRTSNTNNISGKSSQVNVGLSGAPLAPQPSPSSRMAASGTETTCGSVVVAGQQAGGSDSTVDSSLPHSLTRPSSTATTAAVGSAAHAGVLSPPPPA